LTVAWLANSMRNFFELNALQGFKQNILEHHKRFTDKTLNHIVYIDKELWDSPDDARNYIVTANNLNGFEI
jgi:hypothetical protein